ncbi:MAG TPA: proteinase inhibitor I4 serpin [Prolixibacteraceae bacterium]|nr:proteinase inhibitor I4 serpin [Prolixibacteraceae bacterium]
MKRLFTFLILAILTFSCTNEAENQFVTELTTTEKSAKIIAADNQFGFELFQKIEASLDEPKNTMISPMSVSLALAMVYNGAEGNTKKQMEEMLHKAGLTPDDINQSYKDLVAGLASHDPRVELSISNAIYYRNNFPVKADFITTNQNYYNAEVSGLDFTKTTQTLNTVNGWVKNNTKGKIDKIIEEVKPNDIMYLLNAIYFNGEWKYQFKKEDTANLSFTKEDKTVIQVPTMTIENSFNYCNQQNFQLLEMPYGSGKYSMLIFLPASGKNTGDVISMMTVENVTDWISKLTEHKKKVYLPKFEFKFDNSLVDELMALGMTDAFGNANFSGIADAADLVISEVMHKSYIKVDERGTEAAAVTGITVELTSMPVDNSFRADHPFVFAIREKDTEAILFIGKVMNPVQN